MSGKMTGVPRPENALQIASYGDALARIVASARTENARTAGQIMIAAYMSRQLQKFGRTDEALSHITKAIALADLDTYYTPLFWGTMHLNLAALLRSLGRDEEALEALVKASRYVKCPHVNQEIAQLHDKRLIADAERQGTQAEQQGNWRVALDIYVKSLVRIAPRELPAALSQRAIAAAAKMTPPPPIPEEARKHAVFAQTASKQAKNKAEFDTAREYYTRALALAPWWADAWVTLSAVHEQLGTFDLAATDLENYLRAAPGAPDRDEVQNKIYELQFKAQQMGRNG